MQPPEAWADKLVARRYFELIYPSYSKYFTRMVILYSCNDTAPKGVGASSSNRVFPNTGTSNSPMIPHYDIYREELRKAYPYLGHALWQPGPGHCPPVEVGDVGFVRTGRFHRLFNVLLPGDHPSHTLGVPENYEQLQLHYTTHIVPNEDQKITVFQSQGIIRFSGGIDIVAAG